ncbi:MULTISPECIES: hypothetical protein [Flavobacterium]|uniref:hypothetical protein n=1 Tax=Flavobacterium TaxID=237 RepID=UPI001FCC6EAE|nr:MULTISPECIES: hypothetical protein [Flavobacterium]UOK42105.1 hypothetical protein LZF87_12400 [Flavobacterium enshiense]
MMKTLNILALTILIVSCSKLPENSMITAKYIVFNHDISSKTIGNFDNVKELTNSDEITHPFVVDKKFHDLEYAFILNSNGTLDKITEYKYGQNELYQKYQIELDTIDRENIGVGFMIKLDEKLNQIIDCQDTLKILDVYPEEKLIRVDKPENKGRVVFYQYK